MDLRPVLWLSFTLCAYSQSVFNPQWFDSADIRRSTRTWRYAFHPKWFNESVYAKHWTDATHDYWDTHMAVRLTKDLHRSYLQKLANMLLYVKIEEAENYLDADVIIINTCDSKAGPDPNSDGAYPGITYPEGFCFNQCADTDGCAGYGFYGDANEKCPIFYKDPVAPADYKQLADAPPGRVGYRYPYTIPWEAGARWRGRIQLSGSYAVNPTSNPPVLLTDGRWSCQFGPGKSIIHEFFHSMGWKHQFTRPDTELFFNEGPQEILPLDEPTIPWSFASIMQYAHTLNNKGIINNTVLEHFCRAKSAPCPNTDQFQRRMLTGETYDSERTFCTDSHKAAKDAALATNSPLCGMGYDGDTLSHLDRAAMERWWGAKGCTKHSDCEELGYICSIVPRDMIPDEYIRAKEPQYEFPNYGYCRPQEAANFCQLIPGLPDIGVCPQGKRCVCKLGRDDPSPCSGLCEETGSTVPTLLIGQPDELTMPTILFVLLLIMAGAVSGYFVGHSCKFRIARNYSESESGYEHLIRHDPHMP